MTTPHTIEPHPDREPDMTIEAGMLPQPKNAALKLCGVWIRHAEDPRMAAYAIALLTDIKHELQQRGYDAYANSTMPQNYIEDEDGELVLRQFDGTCTALVVGTDEFDVDEEWFQRDMLSVQRALNP